MHLYVAGTRGIPAQHGGFETFAEDLALYLTERGHRVTVFCQAPAHQPTRVTWWNGIELVHLPGGQGAVGTVLFDLRCVLYCRKRARLILTLGYNTAIFSILHRVRGCTHVMNMDGLEWKRDKWSRMERLWLRLNELAGAKLVNHLVADHPVIKKHHLRHAPDDRITTIPYGASLVSGFDEAVLARHGLVAGQYALIIARPEPENSILEMVSAFCRQPRGIKLVILGNYRLDVSFHRRVLETATDQVVFLGAIFDKHVVQSLRKAALLYLHGHKVGGTNPSLVEALAAGNAIVAHENPFTRWVAGEDAVFFAGADHLHAILGELLLDANRLRRMRLASEQRFHEEFQQSDVLHRYETLLLNVAKPSLQGGLQVAASR